MAKGRPKAVRHAKPVDSEYGQETPEAENESQELDDEAPATAERHDVDRNNKASLVRAALAQGYAKPREGCRWIKETFGVEIEGTYYSVAKSQQAKRSSGAAVLRSPGPQHAGLPNSTPLGVPAGFGDDVKAIRGLLADSDNETDALKDLIATVDSLVRKYGVSGLNEMIDAFSA